jgi:uncharacterized membrane protein YfcA
VRVEELTAWSWLWILVYATMLVAGLMQGMFGFGFAVIATPVTVLATDVKTAIVLCMLPTLTVNAIDVVRGGNWRASVGEYWRVAAYVLAGSFVGVQVLIHAPAEPLRLALAGMVFAYLYQYRLAKLDWSWLSRRRRLSELVFGLTAGFFSGSVNLSFPVLLIYFMLLNVGVTAMTQIVNLCFFGGRGVQAVTLAVSGEISMAAALATIPLTAVAIAGVAIGSRIQQLFSRETFSRMLNRILFLVAIVLTVQGLWWLAHTAG